MAKSTGSHKFVVIRLHDASVLQCRLCGARQGSRMSSVVCKGTSR